MQIQFCNLCNEKMHQRNDISPINFLSKSTQKHHTSPVNDILSKRSVSKPRQPSPVILQSRPNSKSAWCPVIRSTLCVWLLIGINLNFREYARRKWLGSWVLRWKIGKWRRAGQGGWFSQWTVFESGRSINKGGTRSIFSYWKIHSLAKERREWRGF